jgi:translation initiation factor 2A
MAVRSHEHLLDPLPDELFPVMPARVMLFDQRVRTLHDFGTSFNNYISFNPQSRLLLLGGFGNLAGKIDIYDRRSLTKISTIDASNTSHCEWSADGKFILTATLSPRLRVDNGIKIWYLLGQLLHVQECEELYQASWRPTLLDAVPPFPSVIPPAPTPSAQAAVANTKPSLVRPSGAYRPPGARGQGASVAYIREEDSGSPMGTPRGSGTATPTRQGRSFVPSSNTPGRRHVPGAPTSHPNTDSAKPRKRKGPKEKGEDGGRRDGGPQPESPATTAPVSKVDSSEPTTNEGPIQPTSGVESGVESLDAVQKKARNLSKKVSYRLFIV